MLPSLQGTPLRPPSSCNNSGTSGSSHAWDSSAGKCEQLTQLSQSYLPEKSTKSLLKAEFVHIFRPWIHFHPNWSQFNFFSYLVTSLYLHCIAAVPHLDDGLQTTFKNAWLRPQWGFPGLRATSDPFDLPVSVIETNSVPNAMLQRTVLKGKHLHMLVKTKTTSQNILAVLNANRAGILQS